MSEMKRCTKCATLKPLTEFGRARQGVRGPILKPNCKTCQAASARQWFHDNKERHKETKYRWTLMATYGITPERYLEMLEEQGGVCAICGQEERSEHGQTGTKYRLSVDHCHLTGRVRGLLCQKCNRSIGLMDDNVELLKKAIDYLERM